MNSLSALSTWWFQTCACHMRSPQVVVNNIQQIFETT